MTKKRYLAVAVVLAATVFLCVFTFALLPPERVTKAKFDRIQDGMRCGEVEQLFGSKGQAAAMGPRTEYEERYSWEASNGSRAYVYFVNDRATIHPIYTVWEESNETVVDKFWGWFGL